MRHKQGERNAAPLEWSQVWIQSHIICVHEKRELCYNTTIVYIKINNKDETKKKTTEKRDDGIALSWKIPATSLLKWHTLLAFFFFSSIY